MATTPEQLDPVEVYSLGRMHLRQGALEQASLFLQKSDRDLLPAQIYLRSQKELARADKRNGDWDRAVEVWMQTLESYDAGIAANEERPICSLSKSWRSTTSIGRKIIIGRSKW
jgi:hypothetical protein